MAMIETVDVVLVVPNAFAKRRRREPCSRARSRMRKLTMGVNQTRWFGHNQSIRRVRASSAKVSRPPAKHF